MDDELFQTFADSFFQRCALDYRTKMGLFRMASDECKKRMATYVHNQDRRWFGEKSTFLQQIARVCDAHAVKELVKYGAEVNKSFSSNAPAVAIAALYGNSEVVEALLEAGASPNAKSKQKEPLLHLAVSQGRADILEMILRHSPDLTAKDQDGTTIDNLALQCKNILIVRMILVHRISQKKLSPSLCRMYLSFFVSMREHDDVETILSSSADSSGVSPISTLESVLYSENRLGLHPMEIAFWNRDDQMVALLIAYGLTPSFVYSDGSLLQKAIIADHPFGVMFSLACGSVVTSGDLKIAHAMVGGTSSPSSSFCQISPISSLLMSTDEGKRLTRIRCEDETNLFGIISSHLKSEKHRKRIEIAKEVVTALRQTKRWRHIREDYPFLFSGLNDDM